MKKCTKLNLAALILRQQLKQKRKKDTVANTVLYCLMTYCTFLFAYGIGTGHFMKLCCIGTANCTFSRK